MATQFSLSFLFHLGSVSCALVAASYVFPFLPPTLTDAVSRFGLAGLRAPCDMPLLFLLLNLLVAALCVSSKMMLGHPADANQTSMKSAALAPELTTSDDGISDDALFCANASPRDAPSDEAPFFGNASSGGNVDEAAGQLETQKRSTRNYRPRPCRLMRSKSDGGLSMLAATGKAPLQLHAVGPLSKRARTFESAWRRRRRRRVKPVVVVADPPEDGQAADEEVDKKAEEFIGRFYQKVKLQRR